MLFDWMFGDVHRDDVRSVELGARWRIIHGHPWGAEDACQ